MSMVAATLAHEADPRAPRRVRHETKRRLLDVIRVEPVAAQMVRVTLGGEELRGFVSLGFDDHVKLFFPDPNAVAPAPGGEPAMLSRDYTPRRHDAAANQLSIDFALHDAGIATRWAAQAQPGQSLTIGGPRGSFVIPFAFDWHLLMGDETALPAIARRLEELPAGTRAVAIVEVNDAGDEIAFDSKAEVTVAWAHRNGAAPGTTDVLAKTLRTLKLPGGDYYGWVSCESLTAKALRAQLLAENGANPKWLRASGYWRRGTAAIHDTFNE